MVARKNKIVMKKFSVLVRHSLAPSLSRGGAEARGNAKVTTKSERKIWINVTVRVARGQNH